MKEWWCNVKKRSIALATYLSNQQIYVKNLKLKKEKWHLCIHVKTSTSQAIKKFSFFTRITINAKCFLGWLPLVLHHQNEKKKRKKKRVVVSKEKQHYLLKVFQLTWKMFEKTSVHFILYYEMLVNFLLGICFELSITKAMQITSQQSSKQVCCYL